MSCIHSKPIFFPLQLCYDCQASQPFPPNFQSHFLTQCYYFSQPFTHRVPPLPSASCSWWGSSSPPSSLHPMQKERKRYEKLLHEGWHAQWFLWSVIQIAFNWCCTKKSPKNPCVWFIIFVVFIILICQVFFTVLCLEKINKHSNYKITMEYFI